MDLELDADTHFSDILATHMEEKDVTPGRLGKLTGIPRATITNWIKGRVKQPQQWQDLLKLAAALELTAAQANELLAAASYPSLATLRESAANTKALSLFASWSGTRPADNGAPATLKPTSRPNDLLRQLPPPEHHRLVGVEPLLQELAVLLTKTSDQSFVSVEGMGGIGKTTLARTVVTRLAQEGMYDGILWLSARQVAFGDQGQVEIASAPARSLADIVAHLAEQLGQQHLAGLSVHEKLEHVRPILKSGAYLVVVDNLESLSDSQELLPALYPLASPTRFLFTSRHTLCHFPYVFTRTVPPLSFEDSRRLLEHELRRRGRPAQIPQSAVETVYSVVGGLPLALKLVAAQLSYHPLADVVEGLRRAEHALPEQLYSYLYAHSWKALKRQSKILLLSMLDIAPDGEDREWIQLMSGLADEAFNPALRQLLDYSLLEVAGTIADPIYRLHRTTITFLHTAILQRWREHDEIEW